MRIWAYKIYVIIFLKIIDRYNFEKSRIGIKSDCVKRLSKLKPNQRSKYSK